MEKFFAIKMPFSKMKTEKWTGSAWEEGRMPGCDPHLYSEKNPCIWSNNLSGIDPAVLTLI